MRNMKTIRADHTSKSQLVLSSRVVVFLYLFIALHARAADITVTTTADVVNGDVANPTALMANPGSDGISLREAILAANNALGPHTITFADQLAGRTIEITSRIIVTRNSVTLIGLSTPDGRPNITIDAVGTDRVFFVYASDFTMKRIRFISGQPVIFLLIRAGETFEPSLIAPFEVRNILIEENEFDNDGVYTTDHKAAIEVKTDPTAVDAKIVNVRIARNTFSNYFIEGVAVHLKLSGTNGLMEDVIITDNTFADALGAVEFGMAGGSNNRIIGTRIIGNTITNARLAIFITIGGVEDNLASSNLIDDTVISGNVILGELDSIDLFAGTVHSTGNAILTTRIINNLIATGRGIYLLGGEEDVSGNRVEGVQISNNTIITKSQGGLRIFPNLDGASGNIVAEVNAINTIFRKDETKGSENDLAGEVTLDQVSFCITSTPGFAGVNGNMSADPMFVDSTQGDFHLQSGSPAIDAGTSEGAPAADLECRERVGTPDIGAFEFSSTPVARLRLLTAGTGTGIITANPVGRDCATGDSMFYNISTVVALTPVADEGSLFAGWSGDSDCSDGVVTMTSDKTCTATFDTQPVSVAIPTAEVPSSFELRQNYPNPFNPSTTIEFALPRSSYVTLKIFNLLGEEVTRLVDEELSTGRYRLKWDSSGMPSGIYVYFLETEGFAQSRKLILLK